MVWAVPNDGPRGGCACRPGSGEGVDCQAEHGPFLANRQRLQYPGHSDVDRVPEWEGSRAPVGRVTSGGTEATPWESRSDSLADRRRDRRGQILTGEGLLKKVGPGRDSRSTDDVAVRVAGNDKHFQPRPHGHEPFGDSGSMKPRHIKVGNHQVDLTRVRFRQADRGLATVSLEHGVIRSAENPHYDGPD